MLRFKSRGDTYLFSTNTPLSGYPAPFSKLTPKPEIFQYMDLNTIKKLVLPYVFNAEKAKRINAKFNATAKVLKADYFSYTLFKTYLNELKKPLSGEDALRYTKQVMKLPDEFKTLYTKLLWKYVNRTQKIIKEFRTVSGKDHEKPFAVINSNQYKTSDKNKKYCEFYHIPHSMYLNIMKEHNVPVTNEFFNTSESMFQLYVVGVPRKTPTKKRELQSLIDKISLLNYYDKYVLEDKDCPYFRGTKEHLVDVIKNCPDDDLEAYRVKLKKIINTFQQTLKDIE